MKADEQLDPFTGVVYTHVDTPDYAGTFRLLGGSRNEIIPDPESDALIGRGLGDREDVEISVHVDDFRHLSLPQRWHGGTYFRHVAPKNESECDKAEFLDEIGGKQVKFKLRREKSVV
jgi:hypothetical protein